MVHKIAFLLAFLELDMNSSFFKKCPVTLAARVTSGYYFPCKSILHFHSAAVSKTESVIVLVLT